MLSSPGMYSAAELEAVMASLPEMPAHIKRLECDRLQLLGEGAAEAAARRDKAVMLEAVAARERRAQDVCARQGRGIVRRGFGLL